jgi:hypothetical protein
VDRVEDDDDDVMTLSVDVLDTVGPNGRGYRLRLGFGETVETIEVQPEEDDGTPLA